MTATTLAAYAASARADRSAYENAPSRAAVRTGRALTALTALFMLMDGGARLAGFAPYVEGLVAAGYAQWLAGPIGIALIVATLLYLLPRTEVLGALLLTGYLGGAVATHVRLEDPNFFFPVVFATLAWAGLLLRRPALRAALLGR